MFEKSNIWYHLEVKMYGITLQQLSDLMEFGNEHKIYDWQSDGKLLRALQVNQTEGVRSSDVAERVRNFGSNKLPEKRAKTLWEFIWEALQDLTLIILMISGVVSLVLGLTVEEDKSVAWIEGASILAAVAIVVSVTAVNDFQKEKQFKQLSMLKDDVLIRVVRDSLEKQVSIHDIVVGDIVHISTGDNICADGILISGHDIKVNHSALTGESKEINRSVEESPHLYSGTQVLAGNGLFLITAVGVNSQAGIISELVRTGGKKLKKKAKHQFSDTIREENETTPLMAPDGKEAQSSRTLASSSTYDLVDRDIDKMERQLPKQITNASDGMQSEVEEDTANDDNPTRDSVLQDKLEVMAVQIGYAGMVMATLTVIVLVTRYSFKTYIQEGETFHTRQLSDFLKFFITGITVLVVAVPEGLPLAVTIALAYSVKKMLKDNNLVRHLEACETMGNATTICSDKTGTLTTNRMTVVKCRWGTDCPQDAVTLSKVPQLNNNRSFKDVLFQSIAVNSTGDIQQEGVGTFKHVGNNTECALLQYMALNGGDYQTYRKTHEIQHLNTFSSKRKRMSAIIKNPDGNGGYRVLCKGASEVVIGLCKTSIATSENNNNDELDVHQWNTLIHDYATNGLRTLALAYKDITTYEFDKLGADAEFTEKDLVLLGVVGIQDPVRPEVPGAIAQCIKSGITVRMVTGDNIDTARSIAKQCGILGALGDLNESQALVMEGPEFRKKVLDENGTMKMDAFDEIWPRLRVLARSSPADKHTLVTGLMETSLNAQVVAVTGDGTNDAPALKKANVGFSMGIAGTSVAKDASDIILMDDNFNSIVAAVKWGRNIYDNVSKFLQFQLTVNVVAISIAFVGSCVVDVSPLTTIQMLWINLIMDTLASLALATEPPTDSLLDRPPYDRSKPLITKQMLRFICGHSLYQCFIIFGLTFVGPDIPMLMITDDGRETKNPTIHFTMIFNTFVLLQLVNEFNARKVHGELNVFANITQNWLYMLIMLMQFGVQFLIVTFGGQVFSCVQLDAHRWAICLFLALFELPWNLMLIVCFTPISSMLANCIRLAAKFVSRIAYINKSYLTSGTPLGTSVFKHYGKAWPRSRKRVLLALKTARAFKECKNQQKRGLTNLLRKVNSADNVTHGEDINILVNRFHERTTSH